MPRVQAERICGRKSSRKKCAPLDPRIGNESEIMDMDFQLEISHITATLDKGM